MAFFTFAVFACLGAFVVADDSEVDDADVVVITEANFEENLGDVSLALVEFYAPWCGHCKHLAPEWARAATKLKGVIPICKVDATIEKDLANKYGIRGYPTIKVFRNGEESGDYQGPRTEDGIVQFVHRQMQPAVTKLTGVDEAKEFAAKDKLVVLGFFEDDSDDEKAFETAANSLREDASFGSSTDDEVAKAFDVASGDAIILVKNADKEQLRYDGELSGLAAWVKANSLPLVDEIGPDNYKAYVDTNLPMALMFVRLTADYFDEMIATTRKVAENFRSKINFVYVDADKYIQQAQKVGLSGNVIPSFAIDYVQDNKHFAYSETEDLAVDALVAFCNGVLDGSIKPTIKSQPVPEDNEGPVKVVVASQYDEIVNDPTKDVMVEYYAPWCGHCKKLEPIYVELAEKLADAPSIVIAKMDATANDVPPGAVQIRGFPTIAFFPANGKDAPIMFQGDRTVTAMRDFILENADIPITGVDDGDDDGHDHDHDHDDL